MITLSSAIFPFIVLSILLFVVFSVFEEALPIALNIIFTNPTTVFSYLIIINSIFAILFTPLSVLVAKKLGINNSFFIGIALFAISYLIFIFAKDSFVLYASGAIIFSFAEVCTIPSLDTLVASLNPLADKAQLYAISELKQLFFFIGPVLFSWVVTNFSVLCAFSLVVLICLLIFSGLFISRFLPNDKN